MTVESLLRASAVLVAIMGWSAAFAQQTPDDRYKEVQVAATQFSLADPIPSWVNPTAIPDGTGSSPVVIRLADTQLLVDRVPVLFYRRATLINDPASLSAAGSFSIAFAPDYQRVQVHSIYIHRGTDRFDRTTTSTVRFLQREQGLEQGVYNGFVSASILVDDLRAGDTLEYSYSVHGQNPVFAGKYSNFSSWDQGYPALLRRIVLNHPVERHISWRMIGDRPIQPITPKKTVREGMRKIELEERMMPELANESLAPPDYFPVRFIQFSEFSNWREVANWANALFQADAPVGDGIHDIVRKISALGSDEAKVAAALEFVQSEIRYFSVSLGENSHRPEAPDVVLRRRYGDCKDKSLLLITLLRELGIKSRPVLLEIGRRRGLEKTLPSAQFFGHAIVAVSLDNKTYFLDPTRLGQHGLLSRMGQLHEGSQVLVVSPETDGLSTISSENISELVHEELEEHATLPKLGGEGELQTKWTWHGMNAERVRLILERSSRDQYLRWIGGALESRYPGAKLMGEPTIDDDRVQNSFVMTATYKVPKLAVERDQSWIVEFRPDNIKNIMVLSPTADRKMPLRIPGHPFQGKYNFDIIFPDEVSAITDPRAQTFENKYFSLTATSHFRGNIAKASVELTTQASQVEPQDYPKFQEDLLSAFRAIGGSIFVAKSALKKADKTAGMDIADRLRAGREVAIIKITETIKSGKLSGADLANSYCARSEAYGDLGRDDESLQDANEAMTIAPNSTEVILCRAYANYHAGQFDKSIADYSKAISLGGIESRTFSMRGNAKFFSGRLSDARADYVKAAELADKESKLYCELWVLMASRRLGAPFPEALVQKASAEALGEWPRPALAMLTGAITPEKLLTIMDEKKGDDRRMAQAEGYYYLGQHYLAGGDKNAARAYFEKTRSLGVIIYTEHVAAGFELQRLANENAVAPTLPQPDKRAGAQ